MSKECETCLDTTTNKDGICDMCKAEWVEHIASEIEAMLQYDKHDYLELRTERNRVIVEVYDEQKKKRFDRFDCSYIVK